VSTHGSSFDGKEASDLLAKIAFFNYWATRLYSEWFGRTISTSWYQTGRLFFMGILMGFKFIYPN
jgi:hypothetical protein